MEGSCQTCLYWKYLGWEEGQAEKQGRCRRLPPVPCVMDEDGRQIVSWRQPLTLCDDVCGAWKPVVTIPEGE